MIKANFILFLFLALSSEYIAQTPIGTWLFVDDQDGIAKSHVKIYERDGKLFGRIVKFLPEATVTHCNNCKGELKGKSLLEMDVIYDLKRKKDRWYGKILDPDKNRKYSCYISLKDEKTLKLRVYIGTVLLGRNQYWYRVE